MNKYIVNHYLGKYASACLHTNTCLIYILIITLATQLVAARGPNNRISISLVILLI